MTTLRQQLDDYLAYARSLRRSPVHLRMLRYSVLRTLQWLEERHGVTRAYLYFFFRRILVRLRPEQVG